MERKRRLALICAMVGVALGAGHLVQTYASGNAEQSAAAPAPTQVQPVSAGPETPVQTPLIEAAVPAPEPKALAAAEPQAPAQPVIAGMTPSVLSSSLPQSTPTVLADLGTDPKPLMSIQGQSSSGALTSDVNAVTLTAPVQPAEPAQSQILPTTPVVERDLVPAPASPLPASPVIEALLVADACQPTLRLAAAPQAMIGVSLVAPCAPDARVVIAHEGLVFAGKTNAQGSLFLSLPALAVEAYVTARLPEGTEVMESVRVPAMATLRRMGVQWHNDDAFQLHAFENGAGYDEPGHVSAAKPQTPTTGLAGTGGFVTVLGDASVELPMMAEIYTFPAGIATNAEIVIEAAVTESTCGRELLGETIMTLAGQVYVSELTLAMPDCDAVGDILVLKNLVTDLTIAAAN